VVCLEQMYLSAPAEQWFRALKRDTVPNLWIGNCKAHIALSGVGDSDSGY
jgi:hypothetical protein